MPRQAVTLKKYRYGTTPVSKMADNEHATAPLWNSEVLSVKNSVGEPIPELPQPAEQGSKRPSFVNRQDTGDVLPDQPAGPQAISKSKEFECEVATFASQTRSKSGDAEVLAGSSTNEKVNWPCAGADASEVSMVPYLGIVVGQYRATERINFREPSRSPA